MSKKESSAFFEGLERVCAGDSQYKKIDDLNQKEIYKILAHSTIRTDFGMGVLIDCKNVKTGEKVTDVMLPQRITNYLKDDYQVDMAFDEFKYIQFVERIRAKRDMPIIKLYRTLPSVDERD